MSSEKAIKKELWASVVPVLFKLSVTDSHHPPPPPMILAVHRFSYVYLLLELKKYF
jgi:hypothetical protein